MPVVGQLQDTNFSSNLKLRESSSPAVTTGEIFDNKMLWVNPLLISVWLIFDFVFFKKNLPDLAVYVCKCCNLQTVTWFIQ